MDCFDPAGDGVKKAEIQGGEGEGEWRDCVVGCGEMQSRAIGWRGSFPGAKEKLPLGMPGRQKDSKSGSP